MWRIVKAAAQTEVEGEFSVATVVLPVRPQQKFDNIVWQIEQGRGWRRRRGRGGVWWRMPDVWWGNQQQGRQKYWGEHLAYFLFKNRKLSVCVYIHLCVCAGMWKYISVHISAHVCESISLLNCFQKVRCSLLRCRRRGAAAVLSVRFSWLDQ